MKYYDMIEMTLWHDWNDIMTWGILWHTFWFECIRFLRNAIIHRTFFFSFLFLACSQAIYLHSEPVGIKVEFASYNGKLAHSILENFWGDPNINFSCTVYISMYPHSWRYRCVCAYISILWSLPNIFDEFFRRE